MKLKERIPKSFGQLTSSAKRLGELLQRVMPRVALVAVGLFVLRLLSGDAAFFRTTVGGLLERLVSLLVGFTIFYYALRALLWARRRLLWRVRRRLAITYLFIGLTPILLLSALGLLFAVSTSIEGMARLITIQARQTEQDTLENAQALVAALPATADEVRLKAWLDERVMLLQPSLPGARLAVWRSTARGAAATHASTAAWDEPARLTSEPAGDERRGVGDDQTPAGAPLPRWLEQSLNERGEWSGLVYLPSPNPREFFGTPSFRAIASRRVGEQSVTLLLVVPVSRALIRQYSEQAGIRVHPFFQGYGIDAVDVKVDERGIDTSFGASEKEAAPERREAAPERVAVEAGREAARAANDETAEGNSASRKDQFGEPMGASFTPVTLKATNWRDGVRTERFAFMIGWSFTEASRQILGGTELGRTLRTALIFIAAFFLALELLAIIAAAWMTRAVTGTVHKLYQATEYIKRGDFSHRVRVRSHDQLGELAVAFNEMSDNIESLLQERVERERLEREVEIAAEVQAQLFPRSLPPLSTVEIAGECRAARGVAGDYYDYIEVAPGLVAFALADVSGKGISASLVMSNLQATLRAQTSIIAERLKVAHAAGRVAAATAAGLPSDIESGASLPCGVTGLDEGCAVEQMVSSINQQLCRNTESSRFATLFLALYDDGARTLRYTNAGHNPPTLLRADGRIERLRAGGMMTGAFDWAKYEEEQTALAEGDLLLIFSDGITEAQNAAGEEYGEERLNAFLVAHRHLSADEMRRRLFEEIDEWSGTQERGDDQTLVIVKAVNGE